MRSSRHFQILVLHRLRRFVLSYWRVQVEGRASSKNSKPEGPQELSSTQARSSQNSCSVSPTPEVKEYADAAAAVGLHEDNGLPDGVVAIDRCGSIRQGDILDVRDLPFLGLNGTQAHKCSLGVAIVSQTCDLVQTDRPFFVVAPVVELQKDQASAAKSGRMTRYAHLSGSDGPDLFADLALCVTVSKSILNSVETLGVGIDPTDSKAVSKFGSQVGRRFSRFPFPDEVQPYFRPLQDKVTGAHKKNSAVGVLLRECVDLRIESTNWHDPPMQLTIHLIVPAAILPSVDDVDPADVSPSTLAKFNPRSIQAGDLSGIASSLVKKDMTIDVEIRPPDRLFLWNCFLSALIAACNTTVDRTIEGAEGAVTEIRGELWSDEDFTLHLYQRTESLDLDHLSSSSIV
jgi:hypothetical protein